MYVCVKKETKERDLLPPPTPLRMCLCVFVCVLGERGRGAMDLVGDAVCCSVLQCVAVCCRALQCVVAISPSHTRRWGRGAMDVCVCVRVCVCVCVDVFGGEYRV